jgi:hypothetical protein
MMTRTALSTASFARPFTLSVLDGTQPAGDYTIETEEELLEGVSFPTYRRLRTVILLPAKVGSMVTAQAALIDPIELESTLRKSNAGSEKACN